VRSVAEITDELHARGMRVTPQRERIIALLAGNERHPTVDSLYDAVRGAMPTISRRTVYQTVHDLEALGEVRLLDVGTGSVRVDPNVEDAHQHLVCRVCGRVRDVDIAVDELALPRGAAPGFRVDDVDVIFRGTCEECVDPRRRATSRH
jgi:Fe2+ or Zn2+ uptake regulation protein